MVWRWRGVGVALGHDDLMAYCGVACHGLECHCVAWRGVVLRIDSSS